MKRIAIIIAAISVFFTLTAEAGYITDKKPDESKITVEGTFDEAKPNRLLNVSVVQRDYDMSLFPDSVLYNAVIETDANGIFKHEFKVDLSEVSDENSAFTLLLSGYASEEIYKEDFTLYKSQTIKKLLDKIASETDVEAVKKDIENNLEMLNISTDYFLGMTAGQRRFVYSAIMKRNSFSSVADFESFFYENVLLQVLNNCDNKEECKNAVETLWKYTSLNKCQMCEKFDQMNDKSGVYGRLYKKGITDNDGLYEAFNNAVLFSLLENTQNIDEVKVLIEENRNLLGNIYDRISGYQYPNDIYSYLVRKSFRDAAELSNAVSAYITSHQTASGSGGGGGGGGSSGGSSGGASGGVVSYKPVPSPEPVEIISEVLYDLDDASWAKDMILKMYDNNIVSGYEDGSFKPNNPITREEFVHIIMKICEVREVAENSFSDVASGAWYEDDIRRAVSAGLVNGISQTEFGVGLNITRQDAATILYRLAEKLGTKLEIGDAEFTDMADMADYAVESVKALSSSKIILGYEDGSFKPNNSITRAECCTVISRMIY